MQEHHSLADCETTSDVARSSRAVDKVPSKEPKISIHITLTMVFVIAFTSAFSAVNADPHSIMTSVSQVSEKYSTVLRSQSDPCIPNHRMRRSLSVTNNLNTIGTECSPRSFSASSLATDLYQPAHASFSMYNQHASHSAGLSLRCSEPTPSTTPHSEAKHNSGSVYTHLKTQLYPNVNFRR